MCKTIAGEKLVHKELSVGVCSELEGWDGGGKGGRLKREVICI